MIQANELRIGCIIRDKESRHIVEVLTIDNVIEEGSVYIRAFDFIGKYIFESELADEQLSPIKLTEKRLLNCGFEKEKMNEHTDHYNLFPLQIFYNVANGFEYFHSQFGGKFIKVKYIHQLQNLYFILAGKELDIDYRKL